ncbi:MAG TPA: hypothetical protein VK168_21775 [Saprospiraceae bacterium]|nr:hypothetical protein [Saprospiraceae bacterium]
MQKITLILLVLAGLTACQNQPVTNQQDAAAQAAGQPISSAEQDKQKEEAEKNGVYFSNSDLVGSNKAIITGKNVSIKNGPGFATETLGTYDENEPVTMGDYKVVQSEGEGILGKPVKLSGSGGSITLAKGKSVMIEKTDDANGTALAAYEDPAKGRFEAEVKLDVFETRMYAVWHQVKRANGDIGWVFGKYLQTK